jgi:hypothetical protein
LILCIGKNFPYVPLFFILELFRVFFIKYSYLINTPLIILITLEVMLVNFLAVTWIWLILSITGVTYMWMCTLMYPRWLTILVPFFFFCTGDWTQVPAHEHSASSWTMSLALFLFVCFGGTRAWTQGFRPKK